jgi:hypothetical protein
MTNSINDLDYASFDATDLINGVARRVVTASQVSLTAGFSAVGSSVLDTFFATPIVGSGVTYNQASGSLNIVSGTATNSEFLARSRQAHVGSMRLRFTVTASQRIANNNMAVLLADLIGEGLAYTIVNSTTVNVTVPSHGFTAQMVGQFVLIGGITGAAGVPGRYAVASIVNVNTIQFTVAGWPASGSGTCTVFGRNYVRNLFTGTTATAVNWDAQRNGWATGDTVATINTTASPGTLVATELTGRDVFLSDAVRASATTPTFATRASRYENIPDATVPLYVFLWEFNGTTAPASATTWTFGHVVVEDFPNSPVYIQGFRSQGSQNPIPVNATSGSLNSVSQNNIYYNESTTSLAAAATFNGTARDIGIAASNTHRYSAFNAMAFADQAGIIRIESSNDNVTWRRNTADVTVAANTAVVLSVPVTTRYYRVVYVNGATIQTAFMLNTSFTGV